MQGFHPLNWRILASFCKGNVVSTFVGLDALISEVEEHIKDVGQENLQTVLKSENVPTQFVEVMLNVHNKYHDLILTTFQVS